MILKKKMLFITTQLPFPPVSGGVIKTFKLIEHYSQLFDIQLVTLLKGDDQEYVQPFIKKVSLASCHTEALDIPRTPLNLIRSYILAPTLNVFRNYSTKTQEAVNKLLPTTDIVFVDHYEVFSYVPKTYTGKVILHQHNAEYVMWQRLAELETNFIKKCIIYLESIRILKAEREYCTRADLIFAAPNDIEELTKLGIARSKMEVTYHLGDDSPLQHKPIEFEKTEKALFYMGTLSWEANVDGLLWFFDHCWNDIKTSVPNVKLYIIGKNPDMRLLKHSKEDESIIYTGFVEDPETYFQKCRVAIAPLRFGSGTKVKVLTYMYRGIPVVTSPMGVEGLEIENEKHLYFTQDPKTYSRYCIELLQNTEKCTQIGSAGKTIAEEKYSWEKLLDQHFKTIGKFIEI